MIRPAAIDHAKIMRRRCCRQREIFQGVRNIPPLALSIISW
jgi:hypothetical protein